MRLFSFRKIYYKAVQQKGNLVHPLELYIADENNINKAPLLKMDYVYNKHSHNHANYSDGRSPYAAMAVIDAWTEIFGEK